MSWPRRVLIVKPSSLGDIVQALPVLDALRRHWPRATFAWLAREIYVPFLAAHPQLHHVFSFRRRPPSLRALIRDQVGLYRQLRAFAPDVVIDLQGLARSAWFTMLSRAPVRVGLADCREGARWAYNRLVPTRAVHAVDRYWAVARDLVNCDGPQRFVLPTDPACEEWAQELVARLGGRPIALAPGARWETKRWPAEAYAEVANKLASQVGCPVVLIGSAEDRCWTTTIAQRCGHAVLDLAGATDLLKLVALLRRCRLAVGNDSGATHLAAAAGCPTVAIFSCTSPARAAPRGAPVRVVTARISCAGSYLKRCPHRRCFHTIPPWLVVHAALELLEEHGQGQQRQSA